MKGLIKLKHAVWLCCLLGVAGAQQLDKYAVQQSTIVLSQQISPADCAAWLVKGFKALNYPIMKQTATDQAAIVVASKDKKVLISGFCTFNSTEVFFSILNPFKLDDTPKVALKQILDYFTK